MIIPFLWTLLFKKFNGSIWSKLKYLQYNSELKSNGRKVALKFFFLISKSSCKSCVGAMLIFFFITIIIFGFYRLSQRVYEDNPESTFTPLPSSITSLGIELDPDTGVDLSNTEEKKD